MVAEYKRESLADVQSLQRLAQSPRACVNHEVRHRRPENRPDDEVDNLY